MGVGVKKEPMKCPYCLASRTSVLDSRLSTEETSIRRRRHCTNCSKRFTTYERIENPIISIIKKDGRQEPFSRDKIIAGMLRACEKRPIIREHIETAVNKIEAELRHYDTTEVHTRLIGECVARALQKLDHIAYVRFASVYRSFKDVGQFQNEVRKLKKLAKRGE